MNMRASVLPYGVPASAGSLRLSALRLAFPLLLALVCLLLPRSASAQLTTNTVIATNSTWQFKRGTNEASAPIDAWRALSFDDSAWEALPAPFHYGTNALGGDDNLVDGTILNDMSNRYS